MVAVEWVGNGARTNRTSHRTVDVTADVRHDLNTPRFFLHVLTRKQERGALCPIVACDVHVCDLREAEKSALKFGRVGDEFLHLEGTAVASSVVLINVEACEDRLVEVLLQKRVASALLSTRGRVSSSCAPIPTRPPPVSAIFMSHGRSTALA